jgi:hypothetical protein
MSKCQFGLSHKFWRGRFNYHVFFNESYTGGTIKLAIDFHPTETAKTAGGKIGMGAKSGDVNTDCPSRLKNCGTGRDFEEVAVESDLHRQGRGGVSGYGGGRMRVRGKRLGEMFGGGMSGNGGVVGRIFVENGRI